MSKHMESSTSDSSRSIWSDPLGQVLSVMNALGSLWIFGLLVLINSDVLGRTLFTRPINGVPEMIELSLVAIVFLQLGDATRHGRMTRSDGFFNFIYRTRPVLGKPLGFLLNFLGALFMFLIFYGSLPLLIEAYQEGHYAGNDGVFTAPTWPIKLVVVIGCIVTALQFLVLAARFIRFPSRGVQHDRVDSGSEGPGGS